MPTNHYNVQDGLSVQEGGKRWCQVIAEDELSTGIKLKKVIRYDAFGLRRGCQWLATQGSIDLSRR